MNQSISEYDLSVPQRLWQEQDFYLSDIRSISFPAYMFEENIMGHIQKNNSGSQKSNVKPNSLSLKKLPFNKSTLNLYTPSLGMQSCALAHAQNSTISGMT